MWRKFLLTLSSVMTLAGTALAADLPVTPPPPPPIFTWTGLYVGGYGGGEITHTSYNTLVGTPFAGPAYLVAPSDIAGVDVLTSQSLSRGGFTAGAELGYNWQIGFFVLGIETDIGGVTGSTRSLNGGLLSSGASFATVQRVDNGLFGTVRGRLGVAFDRLLLYGTGGLAYTSGSYGFSYRDDFPAGGNASTGTKVGYVVGGGLEYGLTDHVSVKGEFLYSQFARVTATSQLVDFAGLGSTNPFVTSARVQEYTARVGLNYRFSWLTPAPVVAKY
jgi:outer membrane immunogenic protein